MTDLRFEKLAGDRGLNTAEEAILRQTIGLPFNEGLIDRDQRLQLNVLRVAVKKLLGHATPASTARVEEEVLIPDHGRGLWDDVNSFPGPYGPQDAKE